MTNEELKTYLTGLVCRVETYSYEFDLELTDFFESEQEIKGRDLMKCTRQLLDGGNTDAAFACLYLFTIYLKRDNNTDGLETVVTEYGKYFPEEDYPLILELKSRYLKRRKNDLQSWELALECDKKALKLLHSVFFAESTYGVNASYVSTLCRILEYGVKHRDALDKIKGFISEDDCDNGIACINENIKANPSYAKNNFLKAQLLYYRMIAFEIEPDAEIEPVRSRCESCDRIIAEIAEAISKEHMNAKRETYRALADRISAYQSKLAASVAEKVCDGIERSQSFEKCISPMCHTGRVGKKYAFICYSRTDYKAVFKDIYSLYCKNISVQFDRIVKSGNKWTSSVEEAILDADCSVVIFYMSADALISDSIYKELSIVADAEAPNKKRYFFVSVNGEMASKLLYDTYRNNDYDPLFKNTLTPERIGRLLSFFSDSIHFLSRKENDYERKLAADISHYLVNSPEKADSPAASGCGGRLEVNTYTADNDRVFDGVKKPNEDRLIADKENGVFIVADGITRPHGEYDKDGKSAAYDVTKTFCDTVHKTVAANLPACRCADDVTRLLCSAFSQGNAEIAGLFSAPGLFKPATVALCAVIFDGKLCFAYIGDCIGVLIRGKCRYIFAERQTAAVSRMSLSKDELYTEYVNKPGKKHAYGTINGDPLAPSFTVASHFELEDGDKIILPTDGLAEALLHESAELLSNYGLTAIIPSVSEEYDRPPFAKYADDKAMIDIVYRKK